MCVGNVNADNWSVSGVLGGSRAGLLSAEQSATYVFTWILLFGQYSHTCKH